MTVAICGVKWNGIDSTSWRNLSFFVCVFSKPAQRSDNSRFWSNFAVTQSIYFIFYESVVINVVLRVLTYTYTRRKMFYFLSHSVENFGKQSSKPVGVDAWIVLWNGLPQWLFDLIITIFHICKVLLVSASAYFAEMCNLSVGDSRRPYGRDALNASPSHRYEVDSQPSEHQGRVDIYDTRQRESHSVFDQFISWSKGVAIQDFIRIDWLFIYAIEDFECGWSISVKSEFVSSVCSAVETLE